MLKIKIIDGPNMNMLGIREKNIYGQETYEQVVQYIKSCFDEKEIKL